MDWLELWWNITNIIERKKSACSEYWSYFVSLVNNFQWFIRFCWTCVFSGSRRPQSPWGPSTLQPTPASMSLCWTLPERRLCSKRCALVEVRLLFISEKWCKMKMNMKLWRLRFSLCSHVLRAVSYTAQPFQRFNNGYSFSLACDNMTIISSFFTCTTLWSVNCALLKGQRSSVGS